jgi:hypothetical protein
MRPVDNGVVWRRRALGRAATLGMALGVSLLLGACTSSGVDAVGPTSTAAGPAAGGTTSSAGTAATSTTTTIADAKADGQAAADALVTLDDLGAGWTMKKTSAPTAKRQGLAFDCPELVADHPGLGEDADAQTVNGPTFNRAKPLGPLSQSITVFASEAEAEDAVAALHDPAATACARDLLGHTKDAAPATILHFEAEAWSIPDLGDDRAAFLVDIETSNSRGSQPAHLGVAFVRTGRAVTFIGILSRTSVGDAEISDLTAAIDKFVAAFPGR